MLDFNYISCTENFFVMAAGNCCEFKVFAFFIIVLIVTFFLKKYFFLEKLSHFFINKSSSSSVKARSPEHRTPEVPVQGENPEWDAFLAEVLSALGLTLAEISGALLYEIWRAYQMLVQSGNSAAAAEIIRAALEQLVHTLPITLPLFLSIAFIIFMLRTIAHLIKEGKKREITENLRTKKNDKILGKLEKALDDDKLKSYTNSGGYALRKTLEKWIKK